ncbi:hypothetical protein PAPYR_11653 [Paratrimastix pyriformis]|uniref:Uncharacterized protein n=1 Tax=Paratrimastix pyriformis TaxID=342808 RepID=A0ABQ8U3A4_9EUKA|nr:hypothetical protein PAPYR_11653 [Paratrimastix pyriformis]
MPYEMVSSRNQSSFLTICLFSLLTLSTYICMWNDPPSNQTRSLTVCTNRPTANSGYHPGKVHTFPAKMPKQPLLVTRSGRRYLPATTSLPVVDRLRVAVRPTDRNVHVRIPTKALLTSSWTILSTDSKTEPRQNPTSTVTSPQAAPARVFPLALRPLLFPAPFDPAWRSSFDCSLFTANNPAAPSVSRHLNRGITVPVCFLQSFSEYHLDSGICVELHKVLNRLIGVFTSSIRVLTEGTCSNVTAVYRNLSARALAIAQNLEDEQAVGLHTPIEDMLKLCCGTVLNFAIRSSALLSQGLLRPVRRNIWLSPRPTGRPTYSAISEAFRAIGNASKSSSK